MQDDVAFDRAMEQEAEARHRAWYLMRRIYDDYYAYREDTLKENLTYAPRHPIQTPKEAQPARPWFHPTVGRRLAPEDPQG